MRTDLAGDLARAFEEGGLIEPVPEAALGDMTAVHALAKEAAHRLAWPLAGYKIGATSAAARQIMRTSEPFYGPVFERNLYRSGAEVALPLGFLGFECEMALRLGADLPAKPGGYAVAALGIAVDAVVLVIEVVATRQKLEAIGDARSAALDFGFNHGLVLGPALSPPPLDCLAEVEVMALVDGTEVGRGSGRDVLGHPLEALAWLTRQGLDLRAGQLVSTGTCTGIARLAPGQEGRARYVYGGEVMGEVGFRAA